MHEAGHAVVAVMLGMTARAVLERGKPGCGACDIQALPDGTDRLLVALVAGSEAEGRLLHQARQWHASTDDAKAILKVVGGLARPGAAERLARAKRDAARLVRDARVWRAIEEVGRELARASVIEDAQVREAVAAAGLVPAAGASRASGSSAPRGRASRDRTR